MTARLAVARLDELEPAQAHRFRAGQPMHGYCLLSGGQGDCRVTVYVENGQALGDRSGEGGFYYEGWLIAPDGPTSLGAFNLGPGGQGSATRTMAGTFLQGRQAEYVRVTAEPFGGSQFGSIAVLEGRLVWLDTGLAEPSAGAPDQPERPPLEVGHAEWSAEPERQPVAVGGPPSAGAGATLEVAELSSQLAEAPAGERPSPSAAVDSPSVASADAPAAGASVSPSVSPSGGADAAPGGAAPDLRQTNPLVLNVQLVERHPMAPRAAGSAVLNVRQGSVSLSLRGLPSPTALGRDRSTGRPFNVYRVWLVNQQSGVRSPIGFCERAWGENFRFQAEGVALNRHDTILVTVEDRTATDGNHAAPQVLIGSYNP